MGEEREVYFPTKAIAIRYPTFIPKRIEERRKREERKKKLAELQKPLIQKGLARLQKPLIRPVKKKGRGARVSVQRGTKGLLDLI